MPTCDGVAYGDIVDEGNTGRGATGLQPQVGHEFFNPMPATAYTDTDIATYSEDVKFYL